MGHPGGEDVDDLDDWGAAAPCPSGLGGSKEEDIAQDVGPWGSADVGTQVCVQCPICSQQYMLGLHIP